MKFEDVITQVKFQYWNSDESTEYHSSINQFKDWYHFDTQKYGRCFTLQPSKEHTQLGIKQIELQLQARSYISIHSKGCGISCGVQQYLKLSEEYEYSLNWQKYDLIDYGGDVCNNEKEYRRYLCKDLAIQEELLKRFGCTSPFFPNKTKICTNQEEAKMVSEVIRELKYHILDQGKCRNPCSYVEINFADRSKAKSFSRYTLVNLEFKNIIKVTESYFIYSQLSMIAEIGGYVGLFLGISVNMVTNLLEFLIKKVEIFRDYLIFK